ncbi:ATP-binding protein [Paenibacillus hexagrammi]|uniref:Uncharacterized protein n=1 Tax=Paenibacillus hexagrammi TaxID=2908839 RepID=A0ABY3SJP7_9BACL|nr:hypothetical protein [Paenibacillus sp. YPD9-1]UJF34067.1 hypothetical protein L0M14_02155 [Paenibacillus sp. YPD9-1]
MEEMLLHVPNFADYLRRIIREAILHQAVLCFSHVEAMFPEEPDLAARQRIGQWFEQLDAYGGLLFLLADRALKLGWKPSDRLLLEYELKVPDEAERMMMWKQYAEELLIESDIDWAVMSGKFRFTPGQIRQALTLSSGYSAWQRQTGGAGREPASGTVRIETAALYRACYQQVQHRLERKATRIEPRYGWDDVILPRSRKTSFATPAIRSNIAESYTVSGALRRSSLTAKD